MSTVTKPQQAAGAPRPATAAPKSPSKFSQSKQQQYFLFDKENYMWMIGGVVMIFIGFLLMSGGKSANPHEFHYDEIYSIRRITVAPIVILIGFLVEAYAIMKKPKDAPVEPIQG